MCDISYRQQDIYTPPTTWNLDYVKYGHSIHHGTTNSASDNEDGVRTRSKTQQSPKKVKMRVAVMTNDGWLHPVASVQRAVKEAANALAEEVFHLNAHIECLVILWKHYGCGFECWLNCFLYFHVM